MEDRRRALAEAAELCDAAEGLMAWLAGPRTGGVPYQQYVEDLQQLCARFAAVATSVGMPSEAEGEGRKEEEEEEPMEAETAERQQLIDALREADAQIKALIDTFRTVLLTASVYAPTTTDAP